MPPPTTIVPGEFPGRRKPPDWIVRAPPTVPVPLIAPWTDTGLPAATAPKTVNVWPVATLTTPAPPNVAPLPTVNELVSVVAPATFTVPDASVVGAVTASVPPIATVPVGV